MLIDHMSIQISFDYFAVYFNGFTIIIKSNNAALKMFFVLDTQGVSLVSKSSTAKESRYIPHLRDSLDGFKDAKNYS